MYTYVDNIVLAGRDEARIQEVKQMLWHEGSGRAYLFPRDASDPDLIVATLENWTGWAVANDDVLGVCIPDSIQIHP